MDFRRTVRQKLIEVWEKALADGYENSPGLSNINTKLDDKEDIPGETEFPTYSKLISLRSKMSKPQRLFTLTYDEKSKERKNG